MIVLDRDVLVKLSEGDERVVQHLAGYSDEEWTVPALVAWESYKTGDSRPAMRRIQRKLQSDLDRIVDFSDEVALEAAYLDEKLQSQGVDLPAVDLLNLATAHAEGGTFVTHDKHDFDSGPVHSLVDVDVVHTSN